MAQIHKSHHHLNWSTCGFAALALVFLGLAITVNQSEGHNVTLTFVLLFGTVLSGLGAWFHQRWDPGG